MGPPGLKIKYPQQIGFAICDLIWVKGTAEHPDRLKSPVGFPPCEQHRPRALAAPTSMTKPREEVRRTPKASMLPILSVVMRALRIAPAGGVQAARAGSRPAGQALVTAHREAGEARGRGTRQGSQCRGKAPGTSGSCEESALAHEKAAPSRPKLPGSPGLARLAGWQLRGERGKGPCGCLSISVRHV